jgi:ubiquinone/menaquinone biosynthesis C-methylase UbiE
LDRWKFYDITHRDHVVCNPTSVGKLDKLIGLLDLGPEARVLDIASGKGEFIVRVAERHGGPGGVGFHGVAVDISPFCVADLRAKVGSRVPEADFEILEMDGAEYRAESARVRPGVVHGRKLGVWRTPRHVAGTRRCDPAGRRRSRR